MKTPWVIYTIGFVGGTIVFGLMLAMLQAAYFEMDPVLGPIWAWPLGALLGLLCAYLYIKSLGGTSISDVLATMELTICCPRKNLLATEV